ncbi:hypothetical protein [Rummeliibacillus suwonensis]|uniref:hypothetical protein n=1 Tax=Rummeliibacillus suwonensis TaxID=1306154 RepID=UPI001AAED0F6|nr:hypothetical protein [Rummeliibacillus suwonensis]MBO2536960.1 hypothetical protein [Rummeliibacillus suwonensis]
MAGEKIDTEKLEKIIQDVIFTYKEQFGKLPQHVTIHRDGRWREDSVMVAQIFKD